MSLAWEVSVDDIAVVCKKHDTVLSQDQLAEVMGALDCDLIEKAALNYNDFDEQIESAFSEIENQMIVEGLYITDPKRWVSP